MTRRLSPEQRLALQVLHLSAWSDLRAYRGRPEIREAFQTARKLTHRGWRALSPVVTDEMWKRENEVGWAIARCRSRLGLTPSGYFSEAEHPDRHNYGDDLRLVFEWVEDIR